MDVPDSLAPEDLAAADQRTADGRNDAAEVAAFYDTLLKRGLPRRLAADLTKVRCRTKWSAVWGFAPDDLDDDD